MNRHRRTVSTSELESSLHYAQVYLTTDAAAEAYSRRRALRISTARDAKTKRERLEKEMEEMVFLSRHCDGAHSKQITEQLDAVRREWRVANAEERVASLALKSPSLIGPSTPQMGPLPSPSLPPPLGARHPFPRRPSAPSTASSTTSSPSCSPPFRSLSPDSFGCIPSGLLVTSHQSIPNCSAEPIRGVSAQARDLGTLKELLKLEGSTLGANAVVGVQTRQGPGGLLEGRGMAVRLRRGG